MKQSLLYKTLIILFLGLSFSCTESYEIQTKDFESLLVVEATITDELKSQEIKLSKTFRLESDEPNEVSNAQVWVEADNGTKYNFNQSEPGLYTSVNAFRAELNEIYTLKVILSDGSSYSSTAEVLPPPTQIESLEAELVTINGEQGIQVFANSSENVNNATYFRYEYEETYKIVVPVPTYEDLKIINVDFTDDLDYELERVPRTEDLSTCYSTKKNTDIVLASLNETQNTYVERFPIRFIKSDNSIIRERYSILVSQYVQSFEAHNFYKILKKLGTIENLFTENQPGFIQGNIASTANEQENVIGFFQVSSLSSKRIYFNYADFAIKRPKYIFECNYYDKLNFNDRAKVPGRVNDFTRIYYLLVGGRTSFYKGQHPIYSFVSIECTDCSSFSSTLKPEFWEE